MDKKDDNALHTGGVTGSIPVAPTIFISIFHCIWERVGSAKQDARKRRAFRQGFIRNLTSASPLDRKALRACVRICVSERMPWRR